MPDPVNLATGKKVEQSSTESYDGIDHKAELAIDKNDITFSMTKTEPRAWWRLDLGAYYDVDEVMLTTITRLGINTVVPFSFHSKIKNKDYLLLKNILSTFLFLYKKNEALKFSRFFFN